MAGEIALSAPQIEINNIPIPIVPGSCTYNDGFGERKNRPAQSGQNITVYYTEDLSTKFGMVKFRLITEKGNAELVRNWLSNGNQNSIVISEADFNRSMSYAAVINNPEPTIGVDGEIEVEFQGTPLAA